MTRFLASTRRRLEKAQKVINSPEHADGRALGMDIHLIWGEAAMLDLPRIAQLAREAEAAARRLGVDDTAEARIACAATIGAMNEGLAVEEARWSEQPESDRGVKARPCRVVVVDDSPFAARALSHVFERNGFEVRTATTTSEVLDLCATFGPSILVTDVHMPGLEVSELCDRFRAATQGRRTGIVLVSARSDAELQDCLHATGADDFVPKCAGTSAVVNRVLALSKDIAS
jgi:PleD family two-component response regulator